MAFAVRVSGPEMSKAIQAIAFDRGYNWVYGRKSSLCERYLLFNFGSEKQIDWVDDDNWVSDELKKGTIKNLFYDRDEIEEIVNALKNEDKTWTINGHKSKIVEDNLVVGCVKVPFTMVKEIYEEFKKKE